VPENFDTTQIGITLMFIVIPTNAHISSIKLILILLRHVSVFLQHR